MNDFISSTIMILAISSACFMFWRLGFYSGKLWSIERYKEHKGKCWWK